MLTLAKYGDWERVRGWRVLLARTYGDMLWYGEICVLGGARLGPPLWWPQARLGEAEEGAWGNRWGWRDWEGARMEHDTLQGTGTKGWDGSGRTMHHLPASVPASLF